MNILNVTPVADRIMIRKDNNEKKTKGGIYIPDTAKNQKKSGTVLKVGSKSSLKKNDKVFFLERNPVRREYDNHDILIMREIDILVVV